MTQQLAAGRRERIQEFLQVELAGGAAAVAGIEAKAKAAGLTGAVPFGLDKGWRKARAALGIDRRRGTAFKRSGAWHWRLPDKMPQGPQGEPVDSLPGTGATDAAQDARASLGAPHDARRVRMVEASEEADIVALLVEGLRRPWCEPDAGAVRELVAIAWSKGGATVVAIGDRPEAAALLRLARLPYSRNIHLELTMAAAPGCETLLTSLADYARTAADQLGLPLVGGGALIHLPARATS